MHCRLETPVGTLWIEEADGAVSCVTSRPLSGPEGNAPVLEQAKKELTEYFAGTRKTFSVPLNPRGTDFQRAVWAALREIPYGETRSYGEIAAAIGRPKAARAVGGANNKKPDFDSHPLPPRDRHRRRARRLRRRAADEGGPARARY